MFVIYEKIGLDLISSSMYVYNESIVKDIKLDKGILSH